MGVETNTGKEKSFWNWHPRAKGGAGAHGSIPDSGSVYDRVDSALHRDPGFVIYLDVPINKAKTAIRTKLHEIRYGYYSVADGSSKPVREPRPLATVGERIWSRFYRLSIGGSHKHGPQRV